jgi:hypothetical protein
MIHCLVVKLVRRTPIVTFSVLAMLLVVGFQPVPTLYQWETSLALLAMEITRDF